LSIVRKAAKSGLWFAGFKLVTQVFSWTVTIAVARFLSPEDYGLMSMASILTGYVGIFSELGLGAAIVQKENITQRELSSNFWFSILVGLLFAIVGFSLAYPTVVIFNEPRLIHVTQTISIMFIIGSLMVVPFNLLMRDLRFKAIGVIQLIAVAVSSLCMLWMAYKGFGVWTLIGGTILLRLITVILVYLVSGWRPSFHFQWHEVRPLLRFGLNVAGARSLFYIFQKIDVFVVGKILGTGQLGYYTFAMQLASMPTDKIVAVVNQVSFPVFSRFQNDIQKIQSLYFRMSKFLTLIVSPLFFAGALWGEEIVKVVLGEKWVPITLLFQIFCLTQLVVAITAINATVHNAMGRSQWVLYFYLISIILMPPSIYIAAHYGLNAVSVPWIILYPVLCFGWTLVTLKSLGVKIGQYIFGVGRHLFASLLVVLCAKGLVLLFNSVSVGQINESIILASEIFIGVGCYSTYLWFFERSTLIEVWSIRRA